MKGALFLLDVEIDSVFATVLAAMRTTTMTVNNETVDVTSKGDLQRELLENCGIQSVSIKAQGCISSADEL
jgi:predicted secreted protein